MPRPPHHPDDVRSARAVRRMSRSAGLPIRYVLAAVVAVRVAHLARGRGTG